jgi:hypothetical protein
MKVLYIDGDGPFGGASRSLYELVSLQIRNDINLSLIS